MCEYPIATVIWHVPGLLGPCVGGLLENARNSHIFENPVREYGERKQLGTLS